MLFSFPRCFPSNPVLQHALTVAQLCTIEGAMLYPHGHYRIRPSDSETGVSRPMVTFDGSNDMMTRPLPRSLKRLIMNTFLIFLWFIASHAVRNFTNPGLALAIRPDDSTDLSQAALVRSLQIPANATILTFVGTSRSRCGVTLPITKELRSRLYNLQHRRRFRCCHLFSLCAVLNAWPWGGVTRQGECHSGLRSNQEL